MNGYDLSRNFWNWAFDNPEKISPNHCAIYFFAVEHCNRLGWKLKFGFPSQMTMDAIGIKKHSTYIRYFNDLVEFGFFELIQKSKNQYSSNIISLTNALPKIDEAMDKAILNHREKQTESNGQSKRSINKQLNNKTIITTKEEIEVNFNKNENYKLILLKDSFALENFSRMFKTNVKTINHYLELFNSHLITVKEVKINQREYQSHFSNWLRKQTLKTILDRTPNLYAGNIGGIAPLKNK